MSSNSVEVVLRGRDDTGPAYTSATAHEKAFQALMDQSSRKEDAAAQTSVRAQSTREKAFLKVMDAERMMNAEADKARAIESDLANVLSGGANDASKFASAIADGAGKLPGLASPMAALIGAGVILSPMLMTLATGLGGFGLAAAGVIQPVLKAAQAAGGLQANMHKLDPEQQAAARSLLALQREYDQFQQALKPQVIGDWNKGLSLANTLMHSAEPVAKATGNALGGMLTQIDAEFRSGQWQQFFQFMAQQAGPDVRQLTGLFVNLTSSLPPLLQNLQPVASGFLNGADAASNLVRILSQVDAQATRNSQAMSQTSGTFGQATGVLRRVSNAFASLGVTEAPRVWKWIAGLDQPARQTASGMSTLARNTESEAQAAQKAAAALNQQTQAFIKGLSPLNNYVDATITQRSDLASLKTALQASGDKIGYNTQQQRASFSAAQTYIKDLENTASQALQSGQGVHQQAAAIRAALPSLSNVQGKTAAYNTELARLRALMQQLAAMPNITKHINVVTSYSTPAGSFISGGTGAGGLGGGHALATGGIMGAAGGGPRGLALVGEHGPELVSLPSGSMVHSNPDSQRMLSGVSGGAANVQLQVVGNGTDLAEFIRVIMRNHIRVRYGGNVTAALGA